LSYSSALKHVTALLRKLGIDGPPRPLHGFRHSYACALADDGTPIAVICELCGWSDLSAANPYLRASNLDRHALIARVHDGAKPARIRVQKKHSRTREEGLGQSEGQSAGAPDNVAELAKRLNGPE